MGNQIDPDSGRDFTTGSGQRNWIRELQSRAHRSASETNRTSEPEAADVVVEKSKTDKARLSMAKVEYAFDCSNPEGARKAASEGIELLNDSNDDADRRLLADFYLVRAEAHAQLGQTVEAAEDLKLARSLRD
jgi:hypothetical protein